MVVSSPAVVNGVVYVGSYDHLVYAIGASEQTSKSEPTSLLLVAILVVIVLVLLITFLGLFLYRRKHRISKTDAEKPCFAPEERVLSNTGHLTCEL
jgi:predicted transporter